MKAGARRLILALGAVLASHAAAPALAVPVIPAPASVRPAAGAFTVTAGTVIVTSASDVEATALARRLARQIEQARGLRLRVVHDSAARRGGAIVLSRDLDRKGSPEGYRLTVEPDAIRLSAGETAGLRHASATLWHLLTAQEGRARSIRVDAMTIDDAPRFGWRGLMLDSARHYQSPAFIERLLEVMALHKLNVLHWHLTDDQAWRLEIESHPRLAQVGGWRVPAGAAARADIDPRTGRPRLYGGVYTHADVRRLVAYAAERGITIVPEIDMPGHATAAIVAYPELGVPGASRPTAVPADWGVYPNLFNVDEPTFAVLGDVLDEVMALFPGPYVHVGGDEAVKEQWKAAPAVQARMRELGLADEAALQSWFMRRLGTIVQARGRKLIGWDEILEGGLAPDATVMSWRGIDGAVAAARAGHDAVLSPAPLLYIDHVQSDAVDEPPGRGGVESLQAVYAFDPAPATLTPEQQRRILGLQANLWTEHVRTEARAAFMSFPRAAAVAEAGWSADRNWPDFLSRMPAQMGRYRALGWAASDSAFEVRDSVRRDPASGRIAVTLSNQAGVGDLRYTLDGREPDALSPVYAAPLQLRTPARLRARAFSEARPISGVTERVYDDLSLRRRHNRELSTCADKLVLELEDDGPVRGDRAVYKVDLMEGCWLWKDADLGGIGAVSARVGSIPFNFQIGADVEKVVLRAPSTPMGELEVRADGCAGTPIAVLPLRLAPDGGVAELPPVPIAAREGAHDLCLTFTAAAVDPVPVLHSLQLIPAGPRP